jgi:hypothetical protein
VTVAPEVAALLKYHGLCEPVFPLVRRRAVRPHTIVQVAADTRVEVRAEPAPTFGVERAGNGVTFWRAK